MSQSEIIAAMLAAGFIVWLAMNQRLSVYWSILTGGAASAAGTGTAPASPVILKTPGTPGLALNPFSTAGFPTSLRNFITGQPDAPSAAQTGATGGTPLGIIPQNLNPF